MLLPMMFALQEAPLPSLAIVSRKGGYEVTAPEFAAALLEPVQAAARAKAAAYCDKRVLVWRDLSYKTNVNGPTASVSEYRHDFDCITPDAAAHKPAPAGWKASAADDADARRIATLFITRRDAGAFEAAYDMFDPGALGDRARLIEGLRQDNPTAGGSVKVTEVRWLLNPPTVPYPGIFAIVPLTGDYPRLHFYCGYVALYRRASGDYQVIRDFQNFLPKNPQSTPGQVAAMKARLCAD